MSHIIVISRLIFMSTRLKIMLEAILNIINLSIVYDGSIG